MIDLHYRAGWTAKLQFGTHLIPVFGKPHHWWICPIKTRYEETRLSTMLEF